MRIETIINTAMVVSAFVLLITFIPKDRIRETALVVLFKQFLTWFIGLIVVQLGLIVYPVRFFPDATMTSFAFEYALYPAVCAVFNLHFPEGKSATRRFMQYFWFCSVLTAIEVVVERYTEVLVYVHWTWYITWITLFLTFLASRAFYRWFFRVSKNKAAS